MSDSIRRVFQDIPDELDESWLNGVLVGGMASPYDDVELARSYVEAVTRLIEPALAGKEPWVLASPIFYLYRHALELQLKAVVQPSKPSHQLHPLIDAFEKLLRGRAQGGIPPHLRGDLTTFANVDPEGARIPIFPHGQRRPADS